ncbi:uncharacterized protein M6B38_335780 [Iris pallida]|uniref:Leucine-rich repeat-containing N-terminal plant-type domain-containing protein n=1 Tax=Iris pallida TaxID=29817 RepID=A0AAX6H0X4_IRIPA|nr:uncharacterized protein M6B38_335780 [Iris pallida]
MRIINLLLLLLSTLLLAVLPTSQEPVGAADDVSIGIGIGIGGGGNAPPGRCPPPPPAGPRPSDFVNVLQYNAYKVIQRFKSTITCDPKNVTGTWTGPRPCGYTGFRCDTPPGLTDTPTIASVDFNGFGLAAPTLSGFLDGLPDLAIFHANSNGFAGTVPCLAGLRFLYELDFSNNRLSGRFPYELLPLRNLLFLDVRYNSLAGAVPPGAFLLGVDVLFLNNNGFSQPLPANLGASPVKYLTLANNLFTGPIPPSICNASNTLIEVLFLNNRLSGCLPYEVGLLRKATVFDAGSNQITGPIPLSFGCLGKVEQLNLAGNLLYGEVPDSVCRLPSLLNLTLSENYFTSVGASCYGLIKKKTLNIRRNCVPGLPGQRSGWECAQFLAKPKCCPPSTFIPCALRGPEEAGSGAAGLSEEEEIRTPPSVAYTAIHDPHGKK